MSARAEVSAGVQENFSMRTQLALALERLPLHPGGLQAVMGSAQQSVRRPPSNWTDRWMIMSGHVEESDVCVLCLGGHGAYHLVALDTFLICIRAAAPPSWSGCGAWRASLNLPPPA